MIISAEFDLKKYDALKHHYLKTLYFRVDSDVIVKKLINPSEVKTLDLIGNKVSPDTDLNLCFRAHELKSLKDVLVFSTCTFQYLEGFKNIKLILDVESISADIKLDKDFTIKGIKINNIGFNCSFNYLEITEYMQYLEDRRLNEHIPIDYIKNILETGINQLNLIELQRYKVELNREVLNVLYGCTQNKIIVDPNLFILKNLKNPRPITYLEAYESIKETEGEYFNEIKNILLDLEIESLNSKINYITKLKTWEQKT